MQRSTGRVLTTHAGSLPMPAGVKVEAAVQQLVDEQRRTGLDIINEGEATKGGDWLSFADDRFGGFTAKPPKGPPIIALGKDREEFAEFYKWAGARGTLFFEPGEQIKAARAHFVCTGPVSYVGHAALRREIELLGAVGPDRDRNGARCLSAAMQDSD